MPFGRRTTKQRFADNGRIIDWVGYIWDGTQLSEQRRDNTSTRWQYLVETHIPIAQASGRGTADTELFAVITDLVGTPTEIINPRTAATEGAASADLWGNASWNGRIGTPLRLAGQLHDDETGLHCNFHRVYDPGAGRFTTGDP
ncbi:RHS repeat-associated core domain-containing protein [Nocardia cyriacigeorgica]|uniref:RHS repeat-associated core domain-containing protein n=1 Tax=Nocardia cyriacigeorgica TaxID=135487 RepID=UPI003D796098